MKGVGTIASFAFQSEAIRKDFHENKNNDDNDRQDFWGNNTTIPAYSTMETWLEIKFLSHHLTPLHIFTYWKDIWVWVGGPPQVPIIKEPDSKKYRINSESTFFQKYHTGDGQDTLTKTLSHRG